jgi:hypothetical protein
LRQLAVAAFAIVNLACPAASFAQTESALGTALKIGVSHTFRSEALGEQRTINVVLPASYGSNPSLRYPVLYLIDGGMEQDLLHIAGVVRLVPCGAVRPRRLWLGLRQRTGARSLRGRQEIRNS